MVCLARGGLEGFYYVYHNSNTAAVNPRSDQELGCDQKRLLKRLRGSYTWRRKLWWRWWDDEDINEEEEAKLMRGKVRTKEHCRDFPGCVY